jgi:hypothetical protein
LDVSLQELRNRIRQRAGEEESDFVSDAELDNVINVYKRELEDKLVKAYGEDYFLESVTFTSTAQQANYSLSTLTAGTFYKFRGLDEAGGPNGWRDVKKQTFEARNRRPSSFGALPWSAETQSKYRYRIQGGSIVLNPTPAGQDRFQLHWIKQQPPLSLTTDEFDDVNGWAEYVVVCGAIYCKDKSEQDTSILQAERQRLDLRLAEMATNRDASEPLMMPDAEDPYDQGRW